MGKYPYNYVSWGTSMENEEKTNGAVTLSRAFYPNTSDNTTGTFKNANVNNIYDIAGNLYEWTMEGYSSEKCFSRGGSIDNNGGNYPVVYRNYAYPNYDGDNVGFRPSLYIKQ